MVGALALAGVGCKQIKTRMTMKEANNLYNAARYEEAIEKYKIVQDLDPWWADAYRNSALSYLALYEPGSIHEKDIEYSDQAIMMLLRYLQFVPGEERAEHLLIDTYLKTSRYEEAAKFFKKKLEEDPKDTKALLNLGSIYAKAGNFEEARKWFRQRAETEKTNHEAWYSLGVLDWERVYKGSELLFEEKRELIEEGMAALNKAVELKEDYFEAYSYINLLYRQKALTEMDPVEAQKDIQQADFYMRKSLELRKAQMEEGT